MRPRNAVRRYEGATPSEEQEPPAWTRSWVFRFVARVLRVSERSQGRARAPRSKYPPVSSVHDRAIKSRPWKARGALIPRALTPPEGRQGPGSAMLVGQPGGCTADSRGDMHAPEPLVLRSLPQPMGAGSHRPPGPRKRAPSRAKGRRLGCKGEKPWHLSSDPGRANGRPGTRSRRRTMTPHQRRKRVWRMETAE